MDFYERCRRLERKIAPIPTRAGIAIALTAAIVAFATPILQAGAPPDPLPLVPVGYRVVYKAGRLRLLPIGQARRSAASGSGSPASAQSSGIDQVAVASFDAINNALRINALLTPGGVHTPSDANQVFTSIFDPATNAVRVNCVVGCTGGSGGGFTAAGDLSGSGSIQTVIGLQTRPVAAVAPTANQVLAWSGSAWTPTAPAVGAGAGACAANQFVTGVNLGSAPACAQPSFTNITGTLTPSQFPSATGTSQGAIVLAQDLAGSASAPLVSGLQGRPVGPALPSSGQALVWNGSAWTPTTLPSGGAQIAGDLGGTLASPTVIGLQTRPVASTAPTANQVLAWSGTAWTPTTPAAGGGTGACTANQFVTGVNLGSAPNCAQPSFANLSGTIFPVQLPAATGTSLGAMILAKDLAGSATAPLVAGLQGNPVGPATPSTGQVLEWNGSAWTPTTLATGGAVMQVNGTNTTSQSTINFQGGSNIAVSNPSAGNVQIALSGTVPVANGGTGLTSVGGSGQCLTSTGTALAWGSCGTGGTGGALLAPTASQTVQATSGNNITPLAIAPATGTTQTADLFDIWKDSAMTTKAVWVDASGNLNFLGNNAIYGAPGQNTQSFLRLYGSTTASNLAPPYLDLEKVDGSVRTYLAPSTSTGGLLCASANVPGGDCGPTIASTNFLVSAVGGTAPTTNDCVKWISSTQIGDTGSPCGSGGGGATVQVNGTNTTSQATINFQTGSNITVSNPSAGNVAFNLSGVVPVANGGTGQTTAASSFNALAPATSTGGLIVGTGANAYGNLALGASGQCLTSTGSSVAWGACATGGSGSPGGTNTAVQFNNSGAFGGDSTNFTYNSTTHNLTLTGTVTASGFISTGTGAGSTQWTTGAMSPSSTGTVSAGANTANVFSYSDNGGAVTAVAGCTGDLTCTGNVPNVSSLHATFPVQLNLEPATSQFVNDTTTGTQLYHLAKLTGTGIGSTQSAAIVTATTDTSGIVGPVVSGAGTAGSAQLAVEGQATCTFDGTTTAGDYVQNSSATAGACHDAGSTKPASGQIVGRALSTIPTAPAAPTLSQASGGTLAASSYFVKITYVNALGQSAVSPEVNLAVSANNLLTVNSPTSVTGASGYNVYVSNTTGAEVLQNGSVPIAIGTGWTEPTTGLLAGTASPPTATMDAVQIFPPENTAGGGGGGGTAPGGAQGNLQFYLTSSSMGGASRTVVLNSGSNQIPATPVAGTTYILSDTSANYVQTAAVAMSAGNVTIWCANPNVVIQFSAATDGFDFTSSNNRMENCTLDHNSQTGAGTGPLINITGGASNTFVGLGFQNTGSTNPTSGVIEIDPPASTTVSSLTFRSLRCGSVSASCTTDPFLYGVTSVSTETISNVSLSDSFINANYTTGNPVYSVVQFVESGSQGIITNVQEKHNTIYFQGANALGSTYQMRASTQVTDEPLRMDDNVFFAVARINLCVKAFGFHFGEIVNNYCNLNGQTAGGGYSLGDFFHSKFSLNSVGESTGLLGAPFQAIDFGQDVITGNVMQGCNNNAGPCYLFGTTTDQGSDVVFTGNYAEFNSGAAGDCIEIQDNAAGFNVQNWEIASNHCKGDGTAGQVGLLFLDTAGTIQNNHVGPNSWYDVATGISVGAGSTNTYIDRQDFVTVTTPISDSGTGTYVAGGNPQYASAATNFGTAISSTRVNNGNPSPVPQHVSVYLYQAAAGAGCGAGTNTATPTIAWTDPAGNAQTQNLTALSISANGTLGSFENDSVDILSKANTPINISVASTLSSTGCTTTPQYHVNASVTP